MDRLHQIIKDIADQNRKKIEDLERELTKSEREFDRLEKLEHKLEKLMSSDDEIEVMMARQDLSNDTDRNKDDMMGNIAWEKISVHTSDEKEGEIKNTVNVAIKFERVMEWGST